MTLERGSLLSDVSLTGAAWCRAYSKHVDDWLAELFTRAVGPRTEGLALVAVGGYGRCELCPNSDIDVMLLHDRHAKVGGSSVADSQVAAVANSVWYPIWDEGIHLGHSVCTVREALDLGTEIIDTATALLSARHVAGDSALTEQLADRARAAWEKRSTRWLSDLAARVESRHQRAGEVAFHLEPDLKEGRGGLRDVHALSWAEAGRAIMLEHDAASLAPAYSVLLDARVELHRRTGRSANLLLLQEQDGVAEALGLQGADDLMAGVARAARTIAWTSDDTWRRVRSMLRGPLGRVARRPLPLTPGIVLSDREVVLERDVAPGDDAGLALRLATSAACRDAVIERHSLERLAAEEPAMPDPWPPEMRSSLVELLLAGPAAIAVIEALDQRGVWARVLPEWRTVRSRPQRNPYHRYTVDRHLLEAAANAARLAPSVDRPDLLVVGALLHDLGKGQAGDHTESGVILAATVATRMGFAPEDVDTLVAMVRHHLLLPDVASRRDLDDPLTIGQVAAAVGSTQLLRLLAALTEADSRATGPAAWGPWKAELLGRLVERVAQVLDGGEAGGISTEPFPMPDQLARLAEPGQHVVTAADRIWVATDDRPGIFSRIAGVLALHGLDVLQGAAHSGEDGRALTEFRVSDPVRQELPWPRVVADIERALDGRLALNARLAERARTYGRCVPAVDHRAVAVSVHFDGAASATATVIDVYAPDRIGVLYRITRALAELDLDIRSAKVQTLGSQVVDSFYVRDQHGAKVTDPATLRELERAVMHSLAEP